MNVGRSRRNLQCRIRSSMEQGNFTGQYKCGFRPAHEFLKTLAPPLNLRNYFIFPGSEWHAITSKVFGDPAIVVTRSNISKWRVAR